MNYTKHKVIRRRDLGGGYSELLFQKQNLNFLPGSLVKLIGGEIFWVASGLKEPWTRLISKDTIFPAGGSIKIVEMICQFPNLIEDKTPAFVCRGADIAIPLSYISTFPDRKVCIVYLDSRGISLDFLAKRSILHKDLKDIELQRKYYTKDGLKNGRDIS